MALTIERLTASVLTQPETKALVVGVEATRSIVSSVSAALNAKKVSVKLLFLHNHLGMSLL